MQINKKKECLRNLPSVDTLLCAADSLTIQHGRNRIVSVIRDTIESCRKDLLSGKATAITEESILEKVKFKLKSENMRTLRPVINATGIILHTGLGRAVMPADVSESLRTMMGNCNLQIDLADGSRIKREHNIRQLVCDLTGAEDALLVNNNAGATLLVLRALAKGREVIVSRGELIEIGGSFRLPEIMEESGAKLREVGATNKTHLKDYINAINTNTALLLKAHKSNYKIIGFSEEVHIRQIAALGNEHSVTVIDDLGCGALVGLETYGLEHEMTISESLQNGADLVLSSTDKLIGGPQGGLIAGKRKILDQIRACPLYRALRVDKMTLCALEATLKLFREPENLKIRHPVYRMLSRSMEEMSLEAEKLAKRISSAKPLWSVSVKDEKSYLGGGSLPGAYLPSKAVAITAAGLSPNTLALALRNTIVPVISHTRDDATLLNMRTLLPEDHEQVIIACESSES